MTKNIILVIVSLMFFCCQQSTDNDIEDYPENGKALFTIENNEYSGSAYLSPIQTGIVKDRKITIAVSDSIKIKIYSEGFSVGT